MDEQQALTAAQIWEMCKPHIIAGLQKESGFFHSNGSAEHVMRWVYATIRTMPAPGSQK